MSGNYALLLKVLIARPHTGGLFAGPVSPQTPKVMVLSCNQVSRCLKQSGAQHAGIPNPTPGYLQHLQASLHPKNNFTCSFSVSCFPFAGGRVAPTLLYSDAAVYVQLLSSSWVPDSLLNTRNQQYFTTNIWIKFPVSLLPSLFYRWGAKAQKR